MPVLSTPERDRYARHLSLPGFGEAGQRALKDASVLIVGAGGLGSPLALYLAAAGVGRLGLVDFDAVDLSNLHRQLLYGTSDVGRPKLAAARDRLRDVNPHVEVVLHEGALTAANAEATIRAYDVVADGTDAFATRYLVNDACVLLGKPNVYGSIFRFEGQVAVFGAPGGPCYRCLHPEPPPPGLIPSCAEGGVLGVLPGLVGTLQATEVVKLLTGLGDGLVGRMVLVDTLAARFRTVALPRDPGCPICGDAPTITRLADADLSCTPATASEVTPDALRARLRAEPPPFLLDVREPHEHAAGNLGGRLIPLRALAEQRAALPPRHDAEIIVYCQSGSRSAEAVRWLRAEGFTNARSLRGGLRAYHAPGSG